MKTRGGDLDGCRGRLGEACGSGTGVKTLRPDGRGKREFSSASQGDGGGHWQVMPGREKELSCATSVFWTYH